MDCSLFMPERGGGVGCLEWGGGEIKIFKMNEKGGGGLMQLK